MEKIQKIIAASGYASRRKAEELIANKRVKINNQVAVIGQRVSSNDEITIDGVVITKAIKEYYLLYKPIGYITTTNDEKNRRIVTDLIPTKTSIYPVGRLDANTSGLLLLTNDGELTNILIHPKYQIIKKYTAKVDKLITMADIKKIKSGIYMDGSIIVPDQIKVRSKNFKTKTSICEVMIHDGKNHEIKNLFKAIGSNAISLKRTDFAFLNLNGLKKGDFRKLTPKEVKQLYNLKND